MKRKVTNVLIIYGILIAVLSFLCGTSLYLAHFDCAAFTISLKHVSTILGIFVSVLGLFITAFLVILALDAYSKLKEITDAREKVERIKTEIFNVKKIINQHLNEANIIKDKILDTETDINQHLNNWEKLEENAQNMMVNYSSTIYEEIDEQIKIAEIKRDRKLINALKLMQARLAYRFPMLNISIRENLLRILSAIGEKIDIPHIETIIQNENEPVTIKEIAKEVLTELKKK